MLGSYTLKHCKPCITSEYNFVCFVPVTENISTFTFIEAETKMASAWLKQAVLKIAFNGSLDLSAP